MYPIAHGRLINVAAFRARYELESTPFDGPWVQDAPRAEMLRDFAGWEEEVRVLLEVRLRLLFVFPFFCGNGADCLDFVF